MTLLDRSHTTTTFPFCRYKISGFEKNPLKYAYYISNQLLHLWPTVITFGADYDICGQLLLHLEPIMTFVANCDIWSQLLHLTPKI